MANFDGHKLSAMATESPTIVLRTGSSASYASQPEFQFKGQFDGHDFTVKATVDNPSAPVVQFHREGMGTWTRQAR